MQKHFIFLALMSLNPVFGFSQESIKSPIWNNIKIEGAIILEPFLGGVGGLIKGKKQILTKKHFESEMGLSVLYAYQNETDQFSNYIDGYNRDWAFNLVIDWRYYPLNRKNIFIGVEPFSGLANLKTKGSFEITELDISENYENKYSYFNYGFSLLIGYDFGKLRINTFAMSSLKGVLDKGRSRLGDSDSKIYAGLNFSYALR